MQYPEIKRKLEDLFIEARRKPAKDLEEANGRFECLTRLTLEVLKVMLIEDDNAVVRAMKGSGVVFPKFGD